MDAIESRQCNSSPACAASLIGRITVFVPRAMRPKSAARPRSFSFDAGGLATALDKGRLPLRRRCSRRPSRASSSASSAIATSALDVSPCVMQARTTSRPTNFAAESQVVPSRKTRSTMSRTGGDPAGGTRQTTPSFGSLTTLQPHAFARAANSCARSAECSTCAACAAQPPAASDRNSRSPMKRRDHCALVI